MTAFDRAADVLGEAEFEAACMLKAGEVLYHVAGVDLAHVGGREGLPFCDECAALPKPVAHASPVGFAAPPIDVRKPEPEPLERPEPRPEREKRPPIRLAEPEPVRRVRGRYAGPVVSVGAPVTLTPADPADYERGWR